MPPATDSVRHQIADSIITRLQTVTAGASYFNSFLPQNVTRGAIDPNEIVERQTPRITVDLGDEVFDADTPGALAQRTNVAVAVIVKAFGHTDDKSIDGRHLEADRLHRDLIAATTGDITLGSRLIVPLEYVRGATVVEQGREGWYSATIEWLARYRLTWGSP